LSVKPGDQLLIRVLNNLPVNPTNERGGAFPHRGVAGLVGIEGGVVSGVINLESSGVEAPDWRPRHDEHYHEA